MKARVIDLLIGLLLFACGIWACLLFVAHNILDFLFHSLPRWSAWTPAALGSVAAIAALALCVRLKVPALLGSLSLIALAIWFAPQAFEKITITLWAKAYDVDELLLSTVPFLAVAVLVHFRFVIARHHEASTT